MVKNSNNSQKGPRKGPRNEYIVKMEKPVYSAPKLYIPKDANGKTTLDKRWYVYYYYRNPKSDLFDSKSKFKVKGGINKYGTVKLRKDAGKNLILTLTQMLADGLNPYTKVSPTPTNSNFINFSLEEVSVSESILKALEDKKQSWSDKSYQGTAYRVLEFVEFAEHYGFAPLPVKNIQRQHVVEFLNQLKDQNKSPRSVNNYRNVLSSIFSQMVENRHIENNFVLGIRKEKARPLKNHPFSEGQIEDIKKYLSANNSYLLDFIRVLGYSFLRNTEVVRLRIGDIDLKNRIISVETKTQALEKVYITDQLHKLFLKMQLSKYSPSDFLFTRWGAPGTWEANLSTKKKFFSDGFRPVKKEFGFGPEFTIYSFRHSFALNVYDNFVKQGLNEIEAKTRMLPITRHRSIEALSNYLRDLKTMLPKNFSGNITLDF